MYAAIQAAKHQRAVYVNSLSCGSGSEHGNFQVIRITRRFHTSQLIRRP